MTDGCKFCGSSMAGPTCSFSNCVYDRIRAWAKAAGITDPVGEFLVMVEECGELEEALESLHRYDMADAFGDVAVTAIVLHHLCRPDGAKLEEYAFYESSASFMSLCASIASGLRKPKKAVLVDEGCSKLLSACIAGAHRHGLDFLTDCLVPVVETLEQRLADGYVLVNGAALKKVDQ